MAQSASGEQGLRANAPAQGISSLDPFCGGGSVDLLRVTGSAAAGRRRGGAVRALREGAVGALMRCMAFSGHRWGQEALQLFRRINSRLYVQRLTVYFSTLYRHTKTTQPLTAS